MSQRRNSKAEWARCRDTALDAALSLNLTGLLYLAAGLPQIGAWLIAVLMCVCIGLGLYSWYEELRG